jgi:hypothetical protein
MASSLKTSYWRRSRTPRYSLIFALPLLIMYETLAFSLSGNSLTGVRNGADVLLKSLFIAAGGRQGLVVFGALLVGGGALLALRDYRQSRELDPLVFAGMALESVCYGLGFGLVVGIITQQLLAGTEFALVVKPLTLTKVAGLSLPTQLMISLGAGLYEELLFRVILVSALAWFAKTALHWNRVAAGVFSVLFGALIFAAFHYIGPYGDRLEITSFAFRTTAGLVFSALYLLRGFGITAWTHGLYDVFLAIGWS